MIPSSAATPSALYAFGRLRGGSLSQLDANRSETYVIERLRSAFRPSNRAIRHLLVWIRSWIYAIQSASDASQLLRRWIPSEGDVTRRLRSRNLSEIDGNPS